MAKMDSAAVRIKVAMRKNERAVLAHVKQDANDPRKGGFRAMLMSKAWWNALDRLKAKGLVRYDPDSGCYVPTSRGKRSR